MLPGAVDPGSAARYIEEMRRQRLAAKTINAHRLTLARVWKANGMKPIWTITIGGARRRERRRSLRPVEVQLLVDAAVGELRELILMGYYSGARLGDVVNARGVEIEAATGIWRYVPRKSSARPGRPLVAMLPASWASTWARRDVVFPEMLARYERGPSEVTKLFGKLCAKVGIVTKRVVPGRARKAVEVGFHSLRHGWITELVERGAPVGVVQTMVGHTSMDVTAGYVHVGIEAMRDAARLLPELGKASEAPSGDGDGI